jgi:hypothetical protein
MTTLFLSLFLLLPTLWYSWRYSLTNIDPDWALFNMPGFTGAQYGRDFVDCKTPAVHYWYWVITKVVGKSVPRVKFVHHTVVGLAGIVIYWLTGNFWMGLAFAVLINSGFLLAFHGNVGQVPACFIAIAIASRNPSIAAVLVALAVLYEPKLLPSAAVMMLVYGWWAMIPLGVAGVIALLLVRMQYPVLFEYLWENSVRNPKRMSDRRLGRYPWTPWFTSGALVYFLPWIILAVYARPDFLFWLPAIIFALVTGYGGVIRPNHLLPFIPWIALAGIPPHLVLMLWAVDWISGGLYLGSIWMRFYISLMEPNNEAKAAGEFLKDKPGDLWVNGIHTSVYIWAQKPPTYGMTEQIELNTVIPEKRREMLERWNAHPPKWIVLTANPAVAVSPNGYKMAWEAGNTKIGVKI